jgi:hypothetical protein
MGTYRQNGWGHMGIERLREVFVETVAFREVIRPDLGGYFCAKRTSVQSAEGRENGFGEL